MARKIVRKPNLPQETLERARRELERSGEITPVPTSSVGRVTVTPTARPVAVHRPTVSVGPEDLRTEYQYVLTDLRNMAVLASGIMIVLVVLSFVI